VSKLLPLFLPNLAGIFMDILFLTCSLHQSVVAIISRHHISFFHLILPLHLLLASLTLSSCVSFDLSIFATLFVLVCLLTGYTKHNLYISATVIQITPCIRPALGIPQLWRPVTCITSLLSLKGSSSFKPYSFAINTPSS
jgi:hypothetical protein